MHRASRYRLYPNHTQERQFAQLCSVGRFAYNEPLSDQIRRYKRFKAGEAEKPGWCVKAKAALNRKMAPSSRMGMVDRFLRYKATDLIRVSAHFRRRACGHTDNADANAARNILNLGLNRSLAGGTPVTGRGGDNETGAFFYECLVETADDPSTLSWNYRGSPPDFHT